MTMKYITAIMISVLAMVATGCIDNEGTVADYHNVSVTSKFPDEVPTGTPLLTGKLEYTEINTGVRGAQALPQYDAYRLPAGLYDIHASATVRYKNADGVEVERTLRASLPSQEITADCVLELPWFFYSDDSQLVFGEIYAAGSLNATSTGGIRDTYFTIYNNTDQVLYADGLGIAESAFVNSRVNTFEILTPENDREVNFTAGTIWVIPGNGTDHPIPPGESIKIVDQAIDWSAQVPGALNHTDAAFEWVDDNPQDTDNPQVPNLDKWYCYSLSIWIMSNQCNRSYALVRFPQGMTSERYLSEYHGPYDYISAIGTQMHNDKAYLIPNEWIIDGVNLSVPEIWVFGALGNSVDMSYAAISALNRDPERFGRYFSRRVAATTPEGRKILMDTNDSARDFEVLQYNR